MFCFIKKHFSLSFIEKSGFYVHKFVFIGAHTQNFITKWFYIPTRRCADTAGGRSLKVHVLGKWSLIAGEHISLFT